MRTILTVPLLFAGFAARPQRSQAARCQDLSSNALPDTTISIAQPVPEGSFTPPYGGSLDKLPAFCRVAGVIKPSSDSYIRFEVWLPASGWNEKYLGVG